MKMAQKIIYTVTFLLFLSLETVFPLPLQNIGQNVKSDLILLNRLHNQIAANANNDFNTRDLPLGEALDLFYRYGFFSLSVRVVPRDDSGSWLIREPTAAIFQEGTVQKQVRKINNQAFDQDFQIFLCDDEAELMEAYFREFSADGIAQPAKLFTGSWHTNTKSKYLGLSKEMFDANSAFVLVKLTKRSSIHSVVNPRSMHLKLNAESAARNIQVGNKESVMDFISTYGSHYVQDVVVGDAIYQIFALNRDQYDQAKRSLANQQRIAQYKQFYDDHLAPWKIRETGEIMTASGDDQVKTFLDLNLRQQGQFGSTPNVFMLEENPNLLMQLESLTTGTQAVVGMRFGSLESWVPDIQSREYYSAIVDTHASLWSANL